MGPVGPTTKAPEGVATMTSRPKGASTCWESRSGKTTYVWMSMVTSPCGPLVETCPRVCMSRTFATFSLPPRLSTTLAKSSLPSLSAAADGGAGVGVGAGGFAAAGVWAPAMAAAVAKRAGISPNRIRFMFPPGARAYIEVASPPCRAIRIPFCRGSRRRRHRRPGAREAERLLRAVARAPLRDPESLLRFHEALLFLRAYPHGPGVLALTERLLSSFGKRVGKLAAAGADLSAFDAPEVAGVAGTTIGTDFSFDLCRWLLQRHPRGLRVDWDACDAPDRMRATWPAFLPLLEEEALADANVPYRDWLEAASGSESDDLAWILSRYAKLPCSREEREERWDSLGAPVAWDLGDSRASRTRMRLAGPARFFHDAPLLSRRDVSLDSVFAAPPLQLRRLSRREGQRLCDLAREATTARYREFYTFTYADPASVIAARPGRGVELFLLGIEPGRRLPLRAAYGGFVVKNGVPIGYIEGLAFCERLEIGFNMYYTFREGESAWIYAQVLKLHRDALGVTSFSIDPYQLGFENEEAIESGAFWFYRKLGFRPTDPSVRRLVAREEQRIAREAGLPLLDADPRAAGDAQHALRGSRIPGAESGIASTSATSGSRSTAGCGRSIEAMPSGCARRGSGGSRGRCAWLHRG